jgi:long-chain fatty acid transport protein
MRKIGSAALIAAMAAGSAHAGGIERVPPSTRLLFEEGNYLELGWGYLSPDVSGEVTSNVPPLIPGSQSGDMMGGYSLPSIALKYDFGGGFSGLLMYDKPYGANTKYSNADADYFANNFGGNPIGIASANLSTNMLTGILKYTTENNISVYGGVRYETMKANAAVPFVAGYTVDADRNSAWGWLLGAAWEKPEIAARVALTYYSKISHDFKGITEYSLPLGTQSTDTTVDIPQAVSLEFQSGVNEKTLVFGSIVWTNWSAFEIAPTMYGQLTSGASLVDYENDTWTYTLGVGRRFTESWSGALFAAYEPSDNAYRKNLGPTDGYTRLGAALTYEVGKVEVTGGLSYIWIGDAETAVGPIAPATDFTGNTAWAGGIRVGYRF